MAEQPSNHDYEPVAYKGEKKRCCCSRTVYLCVLVVSCVCNLVLVGFIIHRHVGDPNSQHGKQQLSHLEDVSGAVCVSCDHLHVPNDVKMTSSMSDLKITDLDQNSKLCCFKHSDGLGRLLNLLANEHYSVTNGAAREVKVKAGPQTSVSAHMYLDLNAIQTADNRLVWSTEPGLGTAHNSGGIIHRNGSYIIPRDGVYNVYSFLTVKTGEDVSINLVHTVRRLRRQDSGTSNQLLLLDKMSRRENSGVFSTSYLSASLSLKENDEIYVEFSNTSLIYTYAPANFFGIYQL